MKFGGTRESDKFKYLYPIFKQNKNIGFDTSVIQLGLSDVLEVSNETGSNDIHISDGQKITSDEQITLSSDLLVSECINNTFEGNVNIEGNVLISGGTTTALSEVINYYSQYISQALGNVSDTVGGGIILAYDSTGTSCTFSSNMIPGVEGFSNPTLNTVQTNGFSDHDLVKFTNFTNDEDNGWYEVYSHSSNVLTLRGIGLYDTTEFFTNTNISNSSSTGTIVKCNIRMLEFNEDGYVYLVSGDSFPLTRERINKTAGSGISIQDGEISITETGITADTYENIDSISVNALGQITDITTNSSIYSQFSYFRDEARASAALNTIAFASGDLDQGSLDSADFSLSAGVWTCNRNIVFHVSLFCYWTGITSGTVGEVQFRVNNTESHFKTVRKAIWLPINFRDYTTALLSLNTSDSIRFMVQGDSSYDLEARVIFTIIK